MNDAIMILLHFTKIFCQTSSLSDSTLYLFYFRVAKPRQYVPYYYTKKCTLGLLMVKEQHMYWKNDPLGIAETDKY